MGIQGKCKEVIFALQETEALPQATTNLSTQRSYLMREQQIALVNTLAEKSRDNGSYRPDWS